MTLGKEKRPGAGWNTYAALLLVFAGAMQIAIALYLLAAYGLTNDSLEELE